MNVERIALDGVWDFQIDPSDGTDVAQMSEWRSATVPLPWQAQFEDLRYYDGVAWYRRSFEAAALEGRAAILHFGAASYFATVWVNGAQVGEHEGGYIPFEFDVTSQMQPGTNEIVVRIVLATDDHSRFPEYPFSEVPHGKQSWYGSIGGLWQSVWMELRPALHISALQLAPTVADGTIAIAATLTGALPASAALKATVYGPDGVAVADASLNGDGKGSAQVSNAQLWSPDAPNLYSVAVELSENGAVTHTVTDNCGFRTFEARDGRIYLNGEPVYLRGVLDQGYYAETIYTPPSIEVLEDQIHKLKALGFNCLRIHIKVEDPAYYDVADRLGMLVWTEIPNHALLTDASSARAKATLRSIIERDGNHASIFAWTLINENWGTDLPRNPEHRKWLADFYFEAKALDPTRLIVDNSACCNNIHVVGDLDDFHMYRAIPDHALEWDAWVADFATRADWAWASDYTQYRRDDLPLIVSEFGNWGLPDTATILEQGKEAWWMENGHDWGDGIVYPHGVETRYEACGLSKLFDSYADFARDSQEHMARSLHYEISTMRLHNPVGGYIVTELTDVHWECNGLLTMQRDVKHALDPILKEINQDNVIVLRPQTWSGNPGDPISVQVETKGVDGAETFGAVTWNAGAQTGAATVPSGDFTVTLDAPGIVTVTATWSDDSGAVIATNQVDLVCLPQLEATVALRVADDATLAATLRGLGYSVREGLAGAAAGEIVVANKYTADLQTLVQQGARLLLITDAATAAAPDAVHLPMGGLAPREGTSWQGDWATSFAWVRKQGPLATLPGSPILEMEWSPIMPDSVLLSHQPWIQREHSWAGLAVGWVHKVASLLMVMPYGRGQMATTTFKLNTNTLATNAVARTLFAGILALLKE